MDLHRLRAGEWIAAISGAVLIAALFLPWRSVAGADVDGWELLSVLDVLLALLGVLAIGLLALTAVARAPGPGVAADALLTPLALTLAVVCLFRVLDVPDGMSREHGAWIGLVACWGVLAGALVAMRDERLSRPGRVTDQTGVPVAAPVEVETLPCPPPA